MTKSYFLKSAIVQVKQFVISVKNKNLTLSPVKFVLWFICNPSTPVRLTTESGPRNPKLQYFFPISRQFFCRSYIFHLLFCICQTFLTPYNFFNLSYKSCVRSSGSIAKYFILFFKCRTSHFSLFLYTLWLDHIMCLLTTHFLWSFYFISSFIWKDR